MQNNYWSWTGRGNSYFALFCWYRFHTVETTRYVNGYTIVCNLPIKKKLQIKLSIMWLNHNVFSNKILKVGS